MPPEPSRRTPPWPLLVGVATVLSVTAILIEVTWSRAGGNLVYALDDSYIHLAVARNLRDSGTWGIWPGIFTTPCSSLLWPLLLAAANAGVWMPLIFNVVFGIGLLGLFFRERRANESPWFSLGVLLAVIWLAPIPAMIISGMEHLLHALVLLLLLGHLRPPSEEPRPWRTWRSWLPAAIFAALASMTRYESLFVILPIGVVLLRQRQGVGAAMIGFAAALPLGVFAVVSKLKGGFLVPASVLAKAGVPQVGLASLAQRLVRRPGDALIQNPHVFVIVLVTLALLAARPRLSLRTRNMLFITLVATVVHLFLASFGWFFRYELYLVTMFLFAAAEAARDLGLADHPLRWLDRRAVVTGHLALAALLVFPLVRRGASAVKGCVQAPRNIYEQQVQIARFLGRHYRGGAVALNDIGAAAYFSGVRILDLRGLADPVILRARLGRAFDARLIAERAASVGVAVAIVYDPWFKGSAGLPVTWTRVAQWRVGDNVVLGGDTVTFYATTAKEAVRLRAALAAFAQELPPRVEATWL